MKWFSRGRKLYDGYTLSLMDKDIHFYRDSPYTRVMAEKVRKVYVEKVATFEGMCRVLSNDSMKAGLLRLHTPLGIHQEELGTNFLYVPPKERARVVELLKGGILFSINPFCLEGNFHLLFPAKDPGSVTLLKLSYSGQTIVTGGIEEVTLGALIGSGEIIDPAKLSLEEAQAFDRALWEGKLTMWTVFTHEKFFIISLPHKGMFVEREKTWLDKIGLRG